MPTDHDTRAHRKAGEPKSTGSLQPMDGKCGGKLTYTGTSAENPAKFCRAFPLKGKTRCKIHGGRQEHGLADPQGGRHPKAIPTRLVENFERLLQSPQLTSLRREIAWQRAYYEELQERAADGAVVARAVFQAIDAVSAAFTAFRQAAHPGTPQAARQSASLALQQAVARLEASRGPASAEGAVRQELRAMWGTLANLTDKESRQYERLYNMITAERALALRVAEHTAFIEAMERHVPDKAVQRQIRQYVAARFEQLAGGRDRPGLAAGSGAGRPVIDIPAPDPATED